MGAASTGEFRAKGNLISSPDFDPAKALGQELVARLTQSMPLIASAQIRTIAWPLNRCLRPIRLLAKRTEKKNSKS